MEEFIAPDISLKIQLVNMLDHCFDLERISPLLFALRYVYIECDQIG